MKLHWHTRQPGNRFLSIFFAGWAMDFTICRHWRMPPGVDLAIVYDYSESSLNPTFLASYEDWSIISWSMGVWAAASWIAEQQLQPKRFTAVNGTFTPVHSTEGIAPAIFHLTLKKLTPETLRAFQRRMCQSEEHYQQFIQKQPRRSFESALQELTAIHQRLVSENPPPLPPCPIRALGGNKDVIFRPTAQQKAWNSLAKASFELLDISHWDDKTLRDETLKAWETLNGETQTVFAKSVTQRFTQAVDTYEKEAVVQKQTAIQLINELVPHLTQPLPQVLEIGCGTGTLTRLLLAKSQIGTLWLNDLSPTMLEEAKRNCQDNKITIIDYPGNAETLDLPPSLDLILSSSALQWFCQPQQFFERAALSLRAQGFMAFSTFGPLNCSEIATLSGLGLNYPDMETLKSWLSAHFEILSETQEIVKSVYKTPMDVLKHLRASGTSGFSNKPWSKQALQNFCSRYQQQFSLNGGVSLTYHPIRIIARRRGTD